MPAQSATRTQNLSQAIVAELKELIYTGAIQPGERLNEAALALQMGTSRGPIREAIKILAGLGIVTAVTNKGVFVRQLTAREMLEVYELRALVFGFAAERACEHLSEGHRHTLEHLLDAMDLACEAEDSTQYYELNLQFHALVTELSGNRRAHEAYDSYAKELHLWRRKYFSAPGNMRRSNLEHRAIYEAIASLNPAKARAAAEKHVHAGRSRLLAKFDEPFGKPER